MILSVATSAQCAEESLTIPAQDLAAALRQLIAKEHDLNLLFDAAGMAGKRSAPVRGARTADLALRAMLAGTGFAVRRGASGALLIVPQPADLGPPAPSMASGGDNPAIAEILVVASRSLNTAISRSENDIQPYWVFNAGAITSSQGETVEDFLRTRDPDDAQAGALTQAPVANGAATRSQVDLSGLGTAQTLVLVDGRRLPSIPGQDIFQQGDLNGIPPSAVERIETLTSTAGGIFGPGATGGVVNIVLKHNYDSGEFAVDGGGTARGDAGHWRADVEWGHSFGGGNTRMMLVLSHSEDAGLTEGQRDIAMAAREQLLAKELVIGPPVSAGLNLVGFAPAPILLSTTSNVTGALQDYMTFKPLDLPLAAGGLAALYANLGKSDLSLSPDGQGARQSLLTRSHSDAAMFDLRQTVGPRLELFLQGLYFGDTGVATGPRTQPTVVTLGQGVSGFPFEGGGLVTFSTPGWAADSAEEDQTLRITAGGIFKVAGGWNGELDLSWGRAGVTTRSPTLLPLTGSLGGIGILDTGAGIASLFPSSIPPDEVVNQVNEMVDANLRFSGPVAPLPGGAMTMTVLGEFRREYQPNVFTNTTNIFTEQVTSTAIGFQTQSVGSGYAELRAPLLPKQGGLLLRGLELQFAGRFDAQTTTVPSDAPQFSSSPQSSGGLFRGRANTYSFTFGFRTFPSDGLMLRASVATGFLPPASADLLGGVYSTASAPISAVLDPRRGNTPIGSSSTVTYEAAGSPDVRPERARTISIGFVATPAWATGLRLSLDYTRIDKTLEITNYASYDFQYFLDNEGEFPSRVTRAPLTAADAALGYTGGVVTNINATYLNNGRSTVQTVDLNARYQRDTRIGKFSIYTRATWEPDYRREDDPRYGFYQTAGHIDGPLTFRGNAGLDWMRGRWSAGLNIQIYGSYAVTYAENTPILAAQSQMNVYLQGHPTIPSQAYADIQLGYRQSLRARWAPKSLEYRIGVHNILDSRPPLLLVQPNATQPAQSLYYSPYGDPRGRRIDVSLVGRF